MFLGNLSLLWVHKIESLKATPDAFLCESQQCREWILIYPGFCCGLCSSSRDSNPSHKWIKQLLFALRQHSPTLALWTFQVGLSLLWGAVLWILGSLIGISGSWMPLRTPSCYSQNVSIPCVSFHWTLSISLRTDHVPERILGPGSSGINKTVKVPVLVESTF